ncbi:MAG: hypothetical protein GQ552_01610 [Flavobacteriaceae bacterium]|nr:hypothetical protein [Flavobacteriaceae bacterium]
MNKIIIISVFVIGIISVTFGQEKNNTFNKNRFEIAIGYSDLDSSLEGIIATFSYERLFGKSGRLGLEIKGNYDYYSDIEATFISFGPNFNWYPFGRGRWLYIGPSLKTGIIFDQYDENFVLSVGVNSGVQFQFGKVFGIKLGGNYEVLQIYEIDDTLSNLQAFLGINISF